MKFREISRRDKWILFAVDNNASDILPAISWQGYILRGQASSKFALELDHVELEALLQEIWPGLSLVEFSQLVDSLRREALQFDFDLLAKRYSLNPCEKLKRICAILPRLPKQWLNWMAQKKLGLRDLEPLLIVSEEFKIIEGAMNDLISFSPSRAEGVRAIEMIVELSLMKHAIEPLSESKSSSKPKNMNEYLALLNALRYPKRSQQLAEGEMKVKTLPWPRKMLANYQGLGDKTGVEVKFFVQSAQELERSILGLQEVLTDMNHKNLERL